MDRNALLTASRVVFLEAFRHATNDALMLATAAIFRKANFSCSDSEQRTLFEAHRVLQEKVTELRAQLQCQMLLLLDRSLESAYKTFHPASQSSFTGDTLALVEAMHFEDQLRTDGITARFRNAAVHQVRDLNIRITLLFEQRAIKERENPFRPWLITRCIINAVALVFPRSCLDMVLCQQIAENFEESIPLIYNEVNTCFERNGIPAQMPLAAIQMARTGSYFAGGQADSADVPGDNGATLTNIPGKLAFGAYSANAGTHKPGEDEFGTSVNPAAEDAPIKDLMENIRRIVTRMPSTESHLPGQPTTMQHSDASTTAASTARLGCTENSGDRVRRFFASESSMAIFGTSAPDAQIGPHFGSPVDRSISAPLAQMLLHLEAVPRPNATLRMENKILAQRTALIDAADNTSEHLTIDVMAKLFEFILRDDQIPAEIRVQLGRLQLPLLKMALTESTLLTHKAHPVRMLINRIGAVSIGRQKHDPDDARISAKISRVIDLLVADGSASSAQFVPLAEQFDTLIGHEFRAGNTTVDQAARLIENIQNRVVRLKKITGQLSALLQGRVHHDFLSDFLLSTWVHVIAHAECATDTASTAQAATRYKLLVPDLLWSIAPHADHNGNSTLLALIPTIRQTIRDGLFMIGWTEQHHQPILDWLTNAHRAALCNTDDTAAAQSLASLHNDFGQFLRKSAPSCADRTVQDTAVQRAILDTVMREAGNSLALLEQITTIGLLTEDGLIGDGLSTMIDDRASLDGGAFGQLHTGAAFERTLGGTREFMRLKWIDHRAAILVLSVEDQNCPCLIGVRPFLRMLAAGRLHCAETQPLFERALGHVCQSPASGQDSIPP